MDDKIALVGCTKSKQNYECSAKEMYSKSKLFCGILDYLKINEIDEWYILSAKHGLLYPTDIIEPYNHSLYNFNKNELNEWYDKVNNKLYILKDKKCIFLCGEIYRKGLIKTFESYEIPMRGMGIGKQLQYLGDLNENVSF